MIQPEKNPFRRASVLSTSDRQQARGARRARWCGQPGETATHRFAELVGVLRPDEVEKLHAALAVELLAQLLHYVRLQVCHTDKLRQAFIIFCFERTYGRAQRCKNSSFRVQCTRAGELRDGSDVTAGWRNRAVVPALNADALLVDMHDFLHAMERNAGLHQE